METSLPASRWNREFLVSGFILTRRGLTDFENFLTNLKTTPEVLVVFAV